MITYLSKSKDAEGYYILPEVGYVFELEVYGNIVHLHQLRVIEPAVPEGLIQVQDKTFKL